MKLCSQGKERKVFTWPVTDELVYNTPFDSYYKLPEDVPASVNKDRPPHQAMLRLPADKNNKILLSGQWSNNNEYLYLYNNTHTQQDANPCRSEKGLEAVITDIWVQIDDKTHFFMIIGGTGTRYDSSRRTIREEALKSFVDGFRVKIQTDIQWILYQRAMLRMINELYFIILKPSRNYSIRIGTQRTFGCLLMRHISCDWCEYQWSTNRNHQDYWARQTSVVYGTHKVAFQG